MSIRKIRSSWWVDFRFDGTRYRKRSPIQTREGAKLYEANLRGELAKRVGQGLPRYDSRVTFSSFAAEWLETYVATNNKRSERIRKAIILRRHLLPVFGDRPLRAISLQDIEEYKASKLKAGYGPKTVNNQLAVLGRCLRTATEWSILTTCPRIKLLRCESRRIDFLSDAEVDTLLSWHGEPRWTAMIRLALRTGMRQGELLGLDWSDVDLSGGRLVVRRAISCGRLTTPKSGKSRTLPLTDDTIEELQRLAHRRGFVLSADGATFISPFVAYRALRRVCRTVNVREVGWHTMRHTFASQLVVRRVPLRAVQELLGHSTIAMTERYSHLAPSFLDQAVRLLTLPISNFEKAGGQLVGNNEKNGSLVPMQVAPYVAKVG